MPGKKGGLTSKDYKCPLRRPGERREESTTQDGAKETPSSSATNESEGKSPLPVPTEIHAEDPKLSQDPEEKPVDVAADNKQKEPDEKEKEVVSKATKETTENQEDRISSIDTSNAERNVAESITTVTDEALTTESTVKITMKLSPLAKEFVPKTSRLVSAVNAPEFVPAPVPQQNDRPQLLRQRSNTPENELMNCVKDVLFGLMQSPGGLDRYVVTLVNMLKKWLNTLNSLKEVVDVIFEYSITEPNFQYIAAKFCNLLSMEQNIIAKNGEKFRSVLMNRCRDEHLNREVSLQSPDTVPRLLGFAMFEAELFCNYRPLGESEPLKVFHRGLLEMLNTLLQNHTEDCLKCIGKILKMTGFLLDDPMFLKDDKDRKTRVDKVFYDVEQLEKESMLSDSVKSLLSQVIKLRTTNWGNSTTEGAAAETNNLYPGDDGYYFSDNGLGMDELSLDDDLTPVTNPDQWSDYYDDDQETAHLQDTFKYYFPENYDGDYSHEDVAYYLEDDPEYDDDIDEEFQKFIQEQDRLYQ